MAGSAVARAQRSGRVRIATRGDARQAGGAWGGSACHMAEGGARRRIRETLLAEPRRRGEID
jgi:hypothetical protein